MPPRFRIRRSPDRRPFAGFPGLIAGCRVLRRLSMPRHPPYTLKSLATFTASPSTSGPPSPRPPGKHAGRAEQERPRQGVARADDAFRQSPPSRAKTGGRPVMGQLSPKKVLDDARPTESTNLECRTVGTVGTPRGGDHPGCRGGRRGSGQSRSRPHRTAPSLGGPTGRNRTGLLP